MQKFALLQWKSSHFQEKATRKIPTTMPAKPGFRLLIADEDVKRLKQLALDRGIPMQRMCRDAVMALLSDDVGRKQLPAPEIDGPLQRLEKRSDTLAVFLRELAKMADSDPRWGGAK